MKSKYLLLAVILSAAIGCVAQTPQTPSNYSRPKYSATVQVDVSCDDEPLKGQIRSFVSRELRSLGDITIVDEAPDFVLSVIATPAKTQGNIVTGVVIATQFTGTVKIDLTSLKGKVSARSIDMLTDVLNGARIVWGFELQTGSMNDVQSLCRIIVADFDTSALEPCRKLWRQSYIPADKK
jgi:hypothetical protein